MTVAQGAAMSTLGGGAVTPGPGVGACLDTGDTAATALQLCTGHDQASN